MVTAGRTGHMTAKFEFYFVMTWKQNDKRFSHRNLLEKNVSVKIKGF